VSHEPWARQRAVSISDRPEEDVWWNDISRHLAVYFTFEEDARRVERERPAESDPGMRALFGLMTDLRYFDLRDPWLDSRA
jgi:hypothetical protein